MLVPQSELGLIPDIKEALSNIRYSPKANKPKQTQQKTKFSPSSYNCFLIRKLSGDIWGRSTLLHLFLLLMSRLIDIY